jgi:hypothetical protein
VVIKSLFGIFFDPEVGGDMFLRNVGWDFQRAVRRYFPEDTNFQSIKNLVGKLLEYRTSSCHSGG